MRKALLFLFYLFSHRSLHLAKGIASNCCHARVTAFIVTKLTLPHPLIEVGQYVRPQRAAFHRLGNFFWSNTTEFQRCWCARRRARTYCTTWSFVHLRCTRIGKFKYRIRFLSIFSDLHLIWIFWSEWDRVTCRKLRRLYSCDTLTNFGWLVSFGSKFKYFFDSDRFGNNFLQSVKAGVGKLRPAGQMQSA